MSARLMMVSHVSLSVNGILQQATFSPFSPDCTFSHFTDGGVGTKYPQESSGDRCSGKVSSMHASLAVKFPALSLNHRFLVFNALPSTKVKCE